MRRTLYDETHELFRESFREFVETEMVPNHERWEQERIVERSFYRRAGGMGFLCMAAPDRWAERAAFPWRVGQ